MKIEIYAGHSEQWCNNSWSRGESNPCPNIQ